MSHKHDYLESLRRIVARFFRGRVHENQYVGTVHMGEEELEKTVFHPNDVERNLPAYWKYHVPTGRDSEGSWRITHDTHPEYVEEGMQVHFTLFRNEDNPDWIDIYAHYEWSWSYNPFSHLAEEDFSAGRGVLNAQRFFDNETYVVLHNER